MKFVKRLLIFLFALASVGLAQAPGGCIGACKEAFAYVVSHEDHSLSGVVSQEPYGGVARFGVNSRAHPEALRAGFYTMPRKQALRYAEHLFYKGYWLKIHGDEIHDERLAIKMADYAYNLGPIRATILLQRALNDQGYNLEAKGYFGLDTLEAVNNSGLPTDYLLRWHASDFYYRLAMHHSQFKMWKSVWIARVLEEPHIDEGDNN